MQHRDAAVTEVPPPGTTSARWSTSRSGRLRRQMGPARPAPS